MNLEELMQEAKSGNMVAQYDLAEQYGKRLKETEREDEIKEFSRQAVYWLKQSAKQGYGPAVEAVRELNIQIGDTEQLLNEAAAQNTAQAAQPAEEKKKPAGRVSGDTKVMRPIGGGQEEPAGEHRALQEARQRAESVSRTNLLLVIMLGVSLLLNIFLVVFLFRTLRENDGKPAPKASPSASASAQPDGKKQDPSASPSATASAKPSETPAATEAPAASEEPSPTHDASRTGWLDLSGYTDLEVVPDPEDIYDDYVYYAVTVSSALNMRSGPDTKYAQIGTIPDATKVGAVAKSGKWFLVYYEGKFGWVSSTYLTTNLNYAQSSPQVTAAQTGSLGGDLHTW